MQPIGSPRRPRTIWSGRRACQRLCLQSTAQVGEADSIPREKHMKKTRNTNDDAHARKRNPRVPAGCRKVLHVQYVRSVRDCGARGRYCRLCHAEGVCGAQDGGDRRRRRAGKDGDVQAGCRPAASAESIARTRKEPAGDAVAPGTRSRKSATAPAADGSVRRPRTATLRTSDTEPRGDPRVPHRAGPADECRSRSRKRLALDARSRFRRAGTKRLAAMLRDGQLIQNRRGGYGVAQKLDLVPGVVLANPDGYGFLKPDAGGEDLYLSPYEMRKVLHGDRVLGSIVGVDRRGRRQGAIVEVLERRSPRLVGRIVEKGRTRAGRARRPPGSPGHTDRAGQGARRALGSDRRCRDHRAAGIAPGPHRSRADRAGRASDPVADRGNGDREP